MNIYREDGYLNVPAIRAACPKACFFFIIGARRTGKTYGVLDYFHDQQEPYIFMRLTQEELKYTISSKVNMYRENGFPWADDMTLGDGKPLYVYDSQYEEGQTPVAMALALSDVAKIRGYGAKRYKRVVLDEFIPETGAYESKGNGDALKNAYMTINGNRELPQEGSNPPVELWCLANSNDLTSDILASFNLTGQFLLMQKRQQTFCYLPERRACLIMIDKSPISARLARTALFDCVGQTDSFSKMALENVFVNDDDTGVKSRPLHEYVIQCSIDDLTLYRHKTRNEWYIVERGPAAKIRYNTKNPTSYNAFITAWRWQGLANPIDGESIFYSSYTAKIKAYKILKLDK